MHQDVAMSHSFTFKSSELKVIVGEDEETNPFRFGKSVVLWLNEELIKKGFDASISSEDWGWRIDCFSKPYPIWIGCGNMEEDDDNGNWIEPDVNDLTWQCFIESDKPFFKSLFNKSSAQDEISSIYEALSNILESARHIDLLNEQ